MVHRRAVSPGVPITAVATPSIVRRVHRSCLGTPAKAMSNTPQEVLVAGVRIGGGNPVALIAGPCAIEDEAHALRMAEALTRITCDLKIPFIYKSSYDKANRSSGTGYRGPGLAAGLRILSKVRESFGCPVLSDVHLPSEVAPADEQLYMLQ